VAVRCNITTDVVNKLAELQWGVKAPSIAENVMINYLEYLGWETIGGCPAACCNETIHILCEILVNKISYTLVDNIVTFYIADGDIVKGVAPFSYVWDFEEDDFDAAGPIDVEQSVLKVKLGKSPTLLVTKIIVKITDSRGCATTKSCYLTPLGMMCASNYQACLPATRLAVRSNIVVCTKLKALVVLKK
jgi:hypothetical protein